MLVVFRCVNAMSSHFPNSMRIERSLLLRRHLIYSKGIPNERLNNLEIVNAAGAGTQSPPKVGALPF